MSGSLNATTPTVISLSTLTTIPIKKVGKGELLGWEDIFEGRSYISSVRCASLAGTLFKIDAKKFKEFTLKDREIKKQMQTISIERDIVTVQTVKYSSDAYKNMS